MWKIAFAKPILEEYCFESALLCQRNRSCVALKILHIKHFVCTFWLADWTYTSFVGKGYTSDERLSVSGVKWRRARNGVRQKRRKRGGENLFRSLHPPLSHIIGIADAAADTWQIWRTYLLIWIQCRWRLCLLLWYCVQVSGKAPSFVFDLFFRFLICRIPRMLVWILTKKIV